MEPDILDKIMEEDKEDEESVTVIDELLGIIIDKSTEEQFLESVKLKKETQNRINILV